VRQTFTRQGILDSLRATIGQGEPVLGAGCSAGIVAKCAEIAGADLIIVYSTGRSRLMGLPTTALGDSNVETLKMLPEIANVVDRTPLIAGIEAADPQHRRMDELVAKFRGAGFNGVINFPSLGDRPAEARRRGGVGLGLEREAELIKTARDADLITMGYAYSRDQAALLADAGVDVLVPHAGWTTGGLVGSDATSRSLQESIDLVQELIDVARSRHSEVICLAHGGSISSPADTEQLYLQTDAQGFVGASSIERTPIEQAIISIVRDFKGKTLRSTDVRITRALDSGPAFDED
jgi:predicted TIM-barrel enzyme